ncbi:hypothetical protein [uncultured Vibrio sp.]|uniref:hypothetical protein n=1 Tax=uncultured Vibrio sp. TaxID=114054 RepID=UPI0025D06860|nr:hypothetical protein [uncultured Vibrio sp.]
MKENNSPIYSAWCTFKTWSYKNDTNKGNAYFLGVIVGICTVGMFVAFAAFPPQHLVPQLWASGLVAVIALFDLFWLNYEHRKGPRTSYPRKELIPIIVSILGAISVIATGVYHIVVGPQLPSGLLLLFTLITFIGLGFTYGSCNKSISETIKQNPVVLLLTALGLIFSLVSYLDKNNIPLY